MFQVDSVHMFIGDAHLGVHFTHLKIFKATCTNRGYGFFGEI